MIIQKILPPRRNLQTLYYRKLDELKREKEEEEKVDIDITFPIELKRGEVLSFDSYVNAFYLEMWTRYTAVDNVTIILRTTGEIRPRVYNSIGVHDWDGDNRAVGKSEIEADVFCELHKDYREYIIQIKDVNQRGVVYPIIEAREKCTLVSGEYITDTPVSVDEVKPVVIVNYNKDIKTTNKTIDAVLEYGEEIPIVVCDMTGNLNKETFADKIHNNTFADKKPNKTSADKTNKDTSTDKSHKGGKIDVIAASEKRGDNYNKALEHIKNELGDNYTHAIMVDCNVELTKDSIERLLQFLPYIDEFRTDMIIQGDVLSSDSISEGCGYLIRDGKEFSRFYNYDLSKSEDYVALISTEEIDYFMWGLICMPLKTVKPFSPNLIKCVEFDYYLKYKPLSVASLNGFFGFSDTQSPDGIIKTYYYRYRDEFIARVDTDMEVGVRPFRDYFDDEYHREFKKGNFELAFTILAAIDDCMKGPEILDKDDKVAAKIDELTKKFNDNIIKRKGKIKDIIKLEKDYNKLCLKIDKDYDMIIQKWKDEKEKLS
ncbi:MAG: hypothetical protein K5644_01325 [Lachnospiraceae bacterium]|nr:hypothetical protein [Lachnospiraceae bacterium]